MNVPQGASRPAGSDRTRCRIDVFHASSARDRQASLAEWLAGAGEGPEGSSRALLVLAASRGAADDFVRGVSARARCGLLGVQRATPLRLAAQLAAHRLAAAGLAPLGSMATLAVVTGVARRAHRAGALGRLHEVAALHGFPRSLASTISELRLAGLTPSELIECADLDRGVAGDLAHLLAAYEEQLKEWKLADLADQLGQATLALRQHDVLAAAHTAPRQVWLDVPVRSALEAAYLDALASSAQQVAWSVAAGDDETLAAASRFEASCCERQERDAGKAIARLQRTQRYVFEAEVPELPEGDDPAADRSFQFLSAAGEGRECVEVARRMRDLAADGVPFDEMAVAVRQPSTYLPLLEDALRRAEIPAYFSRGVARPDPAGRAFLLLLACAAEGLSASRFAEYLSLGQVPVPDGQGGPPRREVPWVEPQGDQLVLGSMAQSGEVEPVEHGLEAPFRAEGDPEAERVGHIPADPLPTPERWETFLVDAAVVGGSDRWRRRLAGLEAEWRRQIEEQGEDDAVRQRRQLDVDRLGALRRFAMPLVEELEQLPEGGTWGEWLAALESLATRALRKPGSVLRLLAELRPMTAVTSVTLGQVQQVLSEPLSFLRAEPPARRYGRVFIGAADELAGRSFRAVWVPGLAEGVFPRRRFEDPLLLDEQRRCLRRGVQRSRLLLPTRNELAHRERLLLRLAIGAASDCLVVSYPRVDLGQGRSRVPSFYALDLLRAAEGQLPDLVELGQRAAAANASRIGWPAPFSTADAIDVAEYDLAHLRAALGERHRGSARFLLHENVHLRRSLHARARRWRSKWTWADGLVVREGDEPAPGLPLERGRQTREQLAGERPGRRSFSPTALQHYSLCPYRFLLQAVHRLRPKLEVAGFEQLDPLTRGSLFHEIQFELMQEMRQRGSVPVTLENLDGALDHCDRIVDRCAARFEEELAPAIPRIWRGEIETLRNDLRGWLRQVAEEPGWVPIANELAFGLPPDPQRDAASSEAPARVLDAIDLRGSIDLVEADATGRRIRVVDHKTGRAAKEKHLVIAGGRILQPVFYALAAEQLLAKGTPHGQTEDRQVVEGRLHYCTQRGEFQIRAVPLTPEARAAARQVVQRVDEALEQGFLPAAPSQGACRWCDYRLVCGPYEELRTQRKDPEPLAALVQLRKLP